MSLGQPHLQRHKARLGTKSQNNEETGDQQDIFVSHKLNAACGELKAACVQAEEEEAHERKGRTQSGVAQILNGCLSGYLGAVVQHQRHGEEGHKLKAHVHGHGICSHGQCNERGISQHEEAEEAVLAALMGHVAKGVELDKAPDKADQYHEEKAQPVGRKAQGESIADVQEGEYLAAVCEGCSNSHKGADDEQHCRDKAALFIVLDYKQVYGAQHGQQYG